MLPLAAIGMLTFAVPDLAWGSEKESLVLLAFMAFVSLIVFFVSPSIAGFLLLLFGFSELMRLFTNGKKTRWALRTPI